jgi:hypothetical protein
MNQQQHIQVLRVQLLAISRLSQRALDYSIKGYEMRNLDFSRHVPASQCALEEHHRRIKELSRELMTDGIANPADARFTFATFAIAAAVHATHTAAVQIARDTVRLLLHSGTQGSASLERMGQIVNGAMRLCIVALFQQDADHAETVLRLQESLRLHELSSIAPQSDLEQAVMQGLAEVAKQAHEMAEAILFWLNGSSCVATSASENRISLELPPMRAQKDAAALSYLQSKRTPVPKTTQSVSC